MVGEIGSDTLAGRRVLVVGASTGINRLGWWAETTADAWRDLVDTNLIGAALVTQAVLPHLREGHGRIGYRSSHAIVRPWPGLGAYAATKAALDTMIGGASRSPMCPSRDSWSGRP